jgi:hypothetical protein
MRWVEELLLLKRRHGRLPKQGSRTVSLMLARTVTICTMEQVRRGSDALRAVCPIFFMCTEIFTIDLVVADNTLCSYTSHSPVTVTLSLTLLPT